MAVSKGNPITAAYFNSLQTTLGNVMGAGSGNSGWGQTVSSAQLSVGTQIKASHWSSLYTDINKAWQQIFGVSVPAASCPVITAGTVIRASDISLYESAITNVNTNRLTIAAGNWTSFSDQYRNTRASAWGGGGNTGITCTFNVTWSSEDAARYFFNSGGSVAFALVHPSTATTQDSNWNTMLTNVGSLSLGAAGSWRTGTLGTLNTALGYYGLTGTAASWFTGSHIGTGAYVNNDATITMAKITNGFQVHITLQDEHTNSFYDSVQAGTYVTVAYGKATAIMSGITSPGITTVTNF
jgi:hypothetical protein